MRRIDKSLHQDIHRSMMNIHPENIFTHRVNVFSIFEDLVQPIHGNILDVGCGSGYASIWLAKNKPVNQIIALEASSQAVHELIPRNIAYHNVEDLVTPLEGTFDNIPFENHFDYVIAFGALHHSRCLWSTMQSISKSMKDGGFLIAQEPAMPNMTTNQQYIDKYNVIENRFGVEIRNGDRDDHFFREAAYIVSATFSGMDVVYFEDYKRKIKKDNFINTIKYYMKNSYDFVKSLQYLVSKKDNEDAESDLINPINLHIKNVNPKVMIFQKNETEYIPHKWHPLSNY